MKKCRHPLKYHKGRNHYYEECHGWHLTEFDIYCDKCGEDLSHWAYGSAEPEYVIRYELKGFKKVKTWIWFYIIERIRGIMLEHKLCKKHYFKNK